MQPGKETSEFRLSTIFAFITAAIGAIVPLLVTQAILTAEQGEALISAIGIVGTLLALFVPGWIVTNYANNRTNLKKTAELARNNTE